MNIGFIPIDNRPVCYTLAEQIVAIDDSVNLYIPPREFLGDLKKCANIEKIFSWMKSLPFLDAFVVSLDTVAYGGLIPSRRCSDTFDEIKERIFNFKEILKEKNAKIYAFSSIMRISNNNINEEEKEYWSRWGKKIFDYSYHTHKNGCESCIANVVPSDILDDYLSTRKRNFEINKIYLEWQKEGFFDTLVFSKDDCAEYGFNVQEAKSLEVLGGFTKTGADEIPLALLARAINSEKSLQIAPIFLEPEYENLVSNYEDVSIENSVKGQLELAGCAVVEEKDADILLFVNNFKNNQGEIVMKVGTESFGGEWKIPHKPYIIADVRFANGGDNTFVEQILEKELDKNFYGYSGWNTSANTLGSLICAAKVKFFAKDYNHENFLKLQMTRFTDDWAYQANCRQKLEKPDVEILNKIIKPYQKKIQYFLKREYNINCKYPWNRLFEVEIEFN